jgi:nuclease-like protein
VAGSHVVQGAGDERPLGGLLARLHDDETVIVLNDRHLPGSRANVDHIAVTRSAGVWAIDAEAYSGMVQRIDRGGWFRNDYRLYVGSRDCTRDVAGIGEQLAAIRNAIGEPALQRFAARVRGAFCLVNAEWSLVPTPIAIDEVWIGWPEALAEELRAPGELVPEHVRTFARRVAEALPPA